MAEQDPRPLDVLHISLSDSEGGAAKAAYAVHAALRRAGHRSRLLVRRRATEDADVHEVQPLPVWESRRRRVAARLRPARETLPTPTATFNFDLRQDFDERGLFGFEGVDVVCVHRITRFLTVEQLRRVHDHYARPLVWLLHDQSPVTGGCHFSLGCDGFTRSCGRCPQLRSEHADDHTHVVWERKRRLLAELPLTFVGQSSDALRWVERSSLFGGHRTALIPQPVDHDVFRPVDPAGARERLSLPREAKVVLLGAGDLAVPRKGIRHAVAALRALDTRLREQVHLLVAGKKGEWIFEQTGLPGTYVGLLHDDLALALLYQASDAYLSPSLGDSGPLMVSESLLCGRPVVAFRVGVAPDLITAPELGALAEPGDEAGLAAGLADVLTRPRTAETERRCRGAAEGTSPGRVAAAYVELLRSL
jgi:glycosyltransferase involved in cell wall biosynthesis